jgi:hypothetical protein
MNKTKSTVIAAAVSGLLMGGMTSCSSVNGATTSAALSISEKHACKGMNTCEGKGGCKTDANACAGKNKCEGKGGGPTVAKHDCSGKNKCKGQGGCKTPANECAGKNKCEGKGGCHVPVKH